MVMLKMNRQRKVKNVLLIYQAILSLTAATVAAIQLLPKKKKRVRRYAVRPMNRNRATEGHFFTLVKQMESSEIDNEQYLAFTRMTPRLFEHLLSLVGPHLQKDITKRPLSPAHRLMLTVNYLAQGCSMHEIARNFRVGQATAHSIIIETCQILWDILSPIQLPILTSTEWENIAEGFYNRWNMPHCFGAIDGKHIHIQSPSYSGTEYFSYKKTFSLVLMAACDAYYRFTMVDIGAAGSNHDGTVFRESGFGNALLSGELDVPKEKELPNSAIMMDYFVVADQAFPLHKHIMRPYPGTQLGVQKNIFNYRLSRARRTIENTFGILVQRWRILRTTIIADVQNCEKFVMATVVLHNFLQKCEADLSVAERYYCPTGFADHCEENGTVMVGRWRNLPGNLPSVGCLGSNNPKKNVQKMRDTLAQYFVSKEGCVPWQWDYIMEGSLPS